MNYTKWLGVDVSKDKLDVAVYDGKRHHNYEIVNEIKSITKFFKKNAPVTCTHVIMEATGIYHMVLFTRLSELGYSVSVVNPLVIKRYSQMRLIRAKTDKVDARLIAEYGYNQKPELSKLPSEEQVNITSRLKAINSFQNLNLMLSNKIHALKSSGTNDKLVIKEYMLSIKANKRSIERLENQIMEIVRENFQDEYDLLVKIPGVGFKTASLTIGFFSRFEDFETAKQVVGFVGLNPNPRESGSSVMRGSNISKKGNPLVRKILYEASLSASQYNPDCKELYVRLLSKGMPKTKCRVAVAHKLLRQIFAVLKYERDWCPSYHKQRNYCHSQNFRY